MNENVKIGLLVAVGTVVLIALVFGLMGLGEQRAESRYTGVVVDVVEDKGILFRPSWVNMKTNTRSSDIQQYCIHSRDEPRLLPRFYAASEEGIRVTVTYSRPLWVSPLECSGNQAIIRSVRPVNGTELPV